MAEPRDIIILGFRTTFYTKVTRGPNKPDGTPGDIIKSEDLPDHWVKYTNRAAPQSMATEERIRHMDPENLKIRSGADAGQKADFFNYRWAQIKPAFDAWLNGQQMPAYGIPISAWPALQPEQIAAFQAAGIRSIEDVRDLHDSQFGSVKLPNIRDLKRLAASYLEGLDANKAAQAQEAMQSQINGLQEQLAAAMALLEEQAQKNAETEGGKKPAKAA